MSKEIADHLDKRAKEIEDNLDKHEREGSISINEDVEKSKYQHQRKQLRLSIAKWSIVGCFSGLAVVIICIMLAVFLGSDEALKISEKFLITIANSLFSVLTLALGFVAGSSID